MSSDAITANCMTLRFPSQTENIALARLCVAQFAGAYFSVDEIDEIKMSVSEAVTNAIVHAYGGSRGWITVAARVDDEGLWVEVADEGCGISDVAWALEATHTTAPEEHMGLGLAFIQSLMDGLKIESAPGAGTRVCMFKRFVAARQPRQH